MCVLKGYRVMASLTQEQIAYKLGISRLSYIHKENNRSRFNEKQRIDIFKLLKNKIPNLKFEDVFPVFEE